MEKPIVLVDEEKSNMIDTFTWGLGYKWSRAGVPQCVRISVGALGTNGRGPMEWV